MPVSRTPTTTPSPLVPRPLGVALPSQMPGRTDPLGADVGLRLEHLVDLDGDDAVETGHLARLLAGEAQREAVEGVGVGERHLRGAGR